MKFAESSAEVLGEVLAEIPRHSQAGAGDEVWLLPFTFEHGLTVLVWSAAMVVCLWWGLRLRRADVKAGSMKTGDVRAGGQVVGGVGRELRFRRGLGWGFLLFVVVYQVFWLTPPRLDVSESLPLQMCDVTGMLAPFALLLGVRAAWTLVYFWGLGLSSQAFVTPVEGASPMEGAYWVFWGMHSVIVLVALYGVVVAGYRPGLRDLGLAIVLGAVYIVLMFLLNAATGWNYGYVGPEEPQPGVVGLLGGYPQRALFLALLGIAAVCVPYLPWVVIGRLEAAGGFGGSPSRAEGGGASGGGGGGGEGG